jgi:hypothetical protein
MSMRTSIRTLAPSTRLRLVPLPRYTGEEPARSRSPRILPCLRGRGTVRRTVEGAR